MKWFYLPYFILHLKAAAKAPEKPKEEEVDALDGGMDMFGGGGGGIKIYCFTF
jgi:hypothetical protein